MSNNKHTGSGVFGKGYYIALILCAAAIGISGYLYYRNASEPAQSLQAVPTEGEALLQENVPAAATAEPVRPREPVPTQPQKKVLRTTAPVSGNTVWGYAMDCLSYSETTRDWRVHNGIDIAAPEGTPVVAAADGTVYTVFEDDAMGTTVVIRHEGGYTTRYASLGKELSVRAGDPVAMGQTIGTVGTTALLETSSGPHVHFCVTCQGSAMDPQEFLTRGA